MMPITALIFQRRHRHKPVLITVGIRLATMFTNWIQIMMVKRVNLCH